jgi:hypothetical protein
VVTGLPMKPGTADRSARRQARTQVGALTMRQIGLVGSPEGDIPAILPAKPAPNPVFHQFLARRFETLLWIPTDDEWAPLFVAVRTESLRNVPPAGSANHHRHEHSARSAGRSSGGYGGGEELRPALRMGSYAQHR